jgi:hypothetical protein
MDLEITLLSRTRTDARISSGSPIRPKAGMFLLSVEAHQQLRMSDEIVILP